MIPKSKAICVLGMHRSGTSVIARAINLLGVYIGQESNLLPPQQDNPEGFWEHREIVKIHDEILNMLSRTWYSTTPLPDKWWKSPEIGPFRNQLKKLIRREFINQELWGWKDPRTCLLLPIWKDILDELNVELCYVIPVRNPLDVSASLEKRDGFSRNESLSLWNLYTLSSLIWSEGSKRVVIQYDHFLAEWETSLKHIAKTLEIPWPNDDNELLRTMSSFIKPNLRHSRSQVEDLLKENLPVLQLSTYKVCLDAAGAVELLGSTYFTDQVKDIYNSYLFYLAVEKDKQFIDEAKDYNLQVYWQQDGIYSEDNSKSFGVIVDGNFHTYEFPIPGGIGSVVRLDPMNFPGYAEIRTIKLLADSKDITLLQYWGIENNFEGVIEGNNIVYLTTSEAYTFLSINDDPQFYISNVPPAPQDSTLKLQIELSVEKFLTPNIISKVQHVFENQTLEKNAFERKLNEVRIDLSYKDELLGNQTNELIELKNNLSEKEDNIKKQVELLSNLQEELNNKDELLNIKYEELNKFQIELIDKTQQLVELDVKLLLLHGDLSLKEKQLHHQSNDMVNLNNELRSIINSTSWRITSPIRQLVNKVRKINKMLEGIASIFLNKEYKLSLLPANQIKSLDEQGKWVSTGNDPYFILNGKFPEGWVSFSWTSKTDQPLFLKLYWDEGLGMSESNSRIMGNMMPGEIIEQQTCFFLNPLTKVIRLDPGDKQVEFHLSDIHMKKISRLQISYKALSTYLKTNGFSIHSFVRLIRKIREIHSTEGLRGIWKKAKYKAIVTDISDGFDNYSFWVKQTEINDFRKEEIINHIQELSYKPLITVIVPVYNVDEVWLRKCIESVQNQLYGNWQLCLADDASTKLHVRKVLEEYAAVDSRITVIFRESNGHISETSNSALEAANGEFIALLDHDDELAIDALYENVALLNKYPDADMIYSDEDKISVNGLRHSPFFKPDWSPDTILSQMYTCHLGLYRSSLVREIGGFRKGYEGSQDYDLVLRLTEKTNRIHHIPKVLYHWRAIPESTSSNVGAKEYTNDAGLRALNDAIQRRNIDGWAERVEHIPNLYRIHYNLKNEPLISILIPTRNMADILDNCLQSIFNKSTYRNFEIIIIDNGSDEQQTFDLFAKWKQIEPKRIRVERIDIPFNYSRLNNLAATSTNGELILLLNNDIEVITTNWLQEMASHALRSSIGAVGACLLYPDNTIQHAGVILGLGGIAGHGHKYFESHNYGYFSRLHMITNYSAVTAACLMVRREVYLEVGGLEEQLQVAFNDVDFCLKIREKGYYNVWLSHVKLYHHESKSRGQEDTPEKQERFRREQDFMRERWGNLLISDPFYNPNLTLEREDFSLGMTNIILQNKKN